jgi:hypothetical protein
MDDFPIVGPVASLDFHLVGSAASLDAFPLAGSTLGLGDFLLPTIEP